MVETAIGMGIPQKDVATLLGIAPETLRLHYSDEIHNGATKANLAVARNLYRMATGQGREAVVAAIFWMKARGGWSDRPPPAPAEDAPRDAETDADGEPIGKKDRERRDGLTAEKGTAWESILAKRPH